MQKPIALTPFEELMLHQDSPAYPVSCFLKLTFSGRLTESAFRSAVNLSVARHPLLHATVGHDRGYHWLPGNVRPNLTWFDEEGPVVPNVSRIDIEREHGICFVVRLDAVSSEVLIQFHHSVCDGIGIYQFTRDLLVNYVTALQGGQAGELPKLNPDLLTGRGTTGLRGLRRLKLVAQQSARIPEVCNFFLRTPSPLVPGDPRPLDAEGPDCFPTLYSHHFSPNDSSVIRDSAIGSATLNDVLARDLFLAAQEFRSWQNLRNEGGSLRFMIPMNLRSTQQHRSPAANMIGAIFLDRRISKLRNPDQLLDSIQRETARAKRLKLGHLFNFALAAYRKMPGGLRKVAHCSRRQVSGVFTNLGRVLSNCPLPHVEGNIVCGDVILRSTEPAAPITPDVSTAIAACWYANRLTLTVHADSRVVSSAAVEKLLHLLVQRVRKSAGLKSDASESRTIVS